MGLTYKKHQKALYDKQRYYERKELNILKNRKYTAKHKYGITLELYEERMATSDTCQICGSPDKLNYDHDHNTHEFRGVLCNSCNRALGLLGDTKDGILKALRYMESHYGN